MNRLLARRILINVFWLVLYVCVIGYVCYANYYVDWEKKIETEITEVIKELENISITTQANFQQ